MDQVGFVVAHPLGPMVWSLIIYLLCVCKKGLANNGLAGEVKCFGSHKMSLWVLCTNKQISRGSVGAMVLPLLCVYPYNKMRNLKGACLIFSPMSCNIGKADEAERLSHQTHESGAKRDQGEWHCRMILCCWLIQIPYFSFDNQNKFVYWLSKTKWLVYCFSVAKLLWWMPGNVYFYVVMRFASTGPWRDWDCHFELAEWELL